jgi:hypothetical protein
MLAAVIQGHFSALMPATPADIHNLLEKLRAELEELFSAVKDKE